MATSKHDKTPSADAKDATNTSVTKLNTQSKKVDKEKEAKLKSDTKDELYSSQKNGTKVVTITDKEHFEKILAEAGDKIIMVEFFATWCGPCRLLAIKLEELANAYNGKAVMVKIDVDDFEDIAAEYNITAMPAFMIMKNKQKLHTFSGSKVEQLENTLEKYVGTPNDDRWTTKKDETITKE